MLILAFDTATPAVTAAVHDGSRVLARKSAVDARRHGELLAPAISAVLRAAGAEPADLTSIAVGTGPGPYTGLRAGLVTAQVLGSTLGIAVDGICTLDIMARQARAGAAGREFIVATDARRGELYWARYSPEGERLTGPDVSLPAGLPAGYPAAGEGPLRYQGRADGGLDWASEPIDPRYPDAAILAALCAERINLGISPAQPIPLYLRRPDAREPGPPKRVTPVASGERVRR
ncbi:MAG TPA: tRNA (adenosine(37)-N6)-threonylcarbamoyltransferase complex dimerization subunit type 1 TsaB [Streptosporangiaceae bacterium]|nr:tRNA (adenosine(37)-N6)-threonylcarbamoyltransferase complex dimerization subunit type 1 TsaB [Streptosporangiaceae bacterium]